MDSYRVLIGFLLISTVASWTLGNEEYVESKSHLRVNKV